MTGPARAEADVLFVPMVPHHEDPPSPRTRELADLLGKVLGEYEKYHPAVTGREVRAAIRLAERNSRAAAPAGRTTARVAAAIAGATVGAFVLVASRGGSWEGAPVAIVIAVGVLFVVAVLARRLRGE